MTGRRKEVKSFILKAGFALLLSLAGFFAARHHRRRRHRSFAPPPTDLEPDEELMMEQTEEVLSGTVLEDIPAAPAPLTEDFEIKDGAAMEEEIKNLRDLVESLQEREIWLEMKLLEFHGVKEQEASMRELQNRLKISATEMKLLSLKIESLKAENERIRAEGSDYCRVVSELEICRKKIMVLESKLRYVGEQAQEKMAVLHGRVTELRERGKKDLEVEKKLRLFSELENEVFELRKENSRSAQEKVGVLKKFEAEHSLNPSVLRSPDSVLRTLELWRLEEQNQLREENENLKKKLEQLQTDHCEDIEELVYLRWINACLRYELRNYQPPPGRTVARDLSRSLSPKSEQKAKQLILDYSNCHSNSNRLSSIDFDLDDCFSQTSSEEFDEASLDSAKTKSTKSSKSKLFRKLKNLVLPKGRNEEKNETRAPFVGSSGLYVEKKKNSTGVEFNGDEKWRSRRNHSHDLTRSSFDIQSLRRLNPEEEEGNGGMHERCNSDIGAVYAHKRMISLDENSPYSSSVENEEVGDPTEDKLKKFARVFKDSKGSRRSKRLSASSSIV